VVRFYSIQPEISPWSALQCRDSMAQVFRVWKTPRN